MHATAHPSPPVWDAIIPGPRVIIERPGSFVLQGDMRFRAGDVVCREILTAASTAMKRISGRVWAEASDPGTAGVWLVLDADAIAPHPELSGERAGAYALSVSPERIVITGVDSAGVAAGLATLAQAVLHAADASLPCVEIRDSPVHEWRGFMFDLARHFFPLQSLHRFLDLLWLLRLNRLHLHLSDDQGWRMPIAEYPLLTEIGAWRHDGTSENGLYGGFYSEQDLRELDRRAGALGVVVVPEIDLPGHASAALSAYPQLGCSGAARSVETRWGIFDAVLCPVGQDTARFIDTVVASVARVFSGAFIHIGGDEVVTDRWAECEACLQYVLTHDLHGVEDLYQTVVRRMAESVVACGRRPVVWDEASRLDLPSQTIIVNWREATYAEAARAKGYDIVLAPQHQRAYLDHAHRDDPLETGRLGVCTPRDSASFEPARYLEEAGGLSARAAGATGAAGASGAADAHTRAGTLLGGQANLWTEGIAFHRSAEYMSIVRLAAISEGLWSGTPGSDSWDRGFQSRLDRLRRLLFALGFAVYAGALDSS